MQAHEINIQHKDRWHYEVTIDGEKINGIRGAQISYSAECIPTAEIEITPIKGNIDVLASLQIALDINDVREAINCLLLEMKLDKDFKDAVIASTASALIEHDISKDSVTEIAETVVERIFEGEYL